MTNQWSLAFAAGMVAAINPCGFALLPAYLSYFLGLESKTGTEGVADAPRGANAVVRALTVSAALTVGFVAVFAPMGVLWSSVSSVLGQRLPWVTAALGVGLVVLGVFMVRGFQPTVNLPKLQVGSATDELWSMVLFGVSYAVASLSCTIGVFGALVTSTFERESFLAGVGAFVAYALGMGLVIAVLTVAVALAREGVVARMRRMLPYMGRISGVLVILAGAYVVYYGWWEIQVLSGNAPSGGPAEAVTRLQDTLREWISDVGAGRIGLVMAAAILAAGGGMALRRSHRSP